MSAVMTRPRVRAGVVRLAKRREISVLLAVLVVIAVATAVNPRFIAGGDGFRNLLITPFLLMVLAVAEGVVIVTKNIDLSVSAVLGLAAWTTGTLFVDHPGIPVPVVMLIGVLVGTAVGVVNGALVSVARVPSLVITLGTLYIVRGIVIAWAGAGRINAGDLPGAFKALGTASPAGIPLLTIVAVVLVVVVGHHLASLRSGRELYAIGSDPDAAVLYGLPVRRRVFAAFVTSGTLAGIAGVLFAARYATISSTAGTGLELQAVAAAVIGGVAISGGSGTVVGAALGAVLLATINRALPTVGIQDFWQQAVVGVLIIGAIVLDRVLTVRNARRLIVAPDGPPAEQTSQPATVEGAA